MVSYTHQPDNLPRLNECKPDGSKSNKNASFAYIKSRNNHPESRFVKYKYVNESMQTEKISSGNHDQAAKMIDDLSRGYL